MPEIERIKQSTFDIIDALIDGKIVYLEDDALSAFFGLVNNRMICNGVLGMSPLRQFFSRIKTLPTLISVCTTSVVLTNENIKNYYTASNPQEEGFLNIALLRNELETIASQGIRQGVDKEPLIITKKQLEDMLDLATKPTDTPIM